MKTYIRNGVITLCLSLLLISPLIAQERVSKPKPVIGSEVLFELKKATGWMLNPDNEWLSLENTIPLSMASEWKRLLSYEKRGLGVDNFKYYQLRDLSYNGKDYFVFIKKYKDGFYEYSSIEEGWIELTSFWAYVFEKEEWGRIDSIKDSQINSVEIEILAIVNLKYEKEEDVMSLIPSKLEWEKPAKKKSQLILHIAPYKEKKHCPVSNLLPSTVHVWRLQIY